MNGIMPSTVSATQLQRNYKKIVKKIKRLREPITVLSKNKPSLVLMDYEQYKKIQKVGGEEKFKDPYGIFADARITNKDIQEVTRAWDKHTKAR